MNAPPNFIRIHQAIMSTFYCVDNATICPQCEIRWNIILGNTVFLDLALMEQSRFFIFDYENAEQREGEREKDWGEITFYQIDVYG
jgi:hypothetical protein